MFIHLHFAGMFEGQLTQHNSIPFAPMQQRARGRLVIGAMSDRDGVCRLKDLRQEGSYKSVFPRPSHGNLEAVVVNTAGGVTGGDRFSTAITAHSMARISVTTQAAERIYRASNSDFGQIRTTLSVSEDAHLYWLPQETILFEGCRIDRSFVADVHPTAKLIMLEPLVFGRATSGEELRSVALRDRVSIKSQGHPIYLDSLKMEGDLAELLARNAISNSARTMASLVLVDPAAEQKLTACRDLLPHSGGASMVADNVLVVRLLAEDSFALRSTLLPILQLMTDNAVPKNWRL